ncbi:GNAT family N-acetyltransferase [Salimicrobium halophilum]|uniref:L-amino acid N-acyltransferase YncA n=1 Tax=Salimicrobium halophilum TaxID=86666 RepID=A0A1G8RAV3_9BACI|nr:GNAT family N-acetyltransferase [Salimicrobium halophilum]SDJ14106.1 L-amino acid N-acyltransferase YncA [Salimicrobium halophilum]
MQIRRAITEDAYGVAKVQVDTWESTYKGIVPEAYLEEMTYENREEKWRYIIEKGMVFIAENDSGEIVGFSSGGPERSEELDDYDAELYAIYIRKEDQRKGIGRKLVTPVVQELLERGMTSMVVAVLSENPFRHFYEALGAKRIDRMKVDISGKVLDEWIYGWADLRSLLREGN